VEVKVGDHIVVDSRRLVGPRRMGVVAAIVHTAPRCYRVRWHDGRVSEFTPAAGVLVIDRHRR
jgi:hypothetical protein